MISSTAFLHEKALVEPGAHIGPNTRVWAFTHILSGARIGADCNICESVFVENNVHVGDRVTIKNGVQLWDGVTLEDDVFVGPNATFTNDSFPRSKQPQSQVTPTLVSRFASIGANATILPGIVIGRNAMVGAGAVVTRDVPPHAIVTGNPARIQGYVESQARPALDSVYASAAVADTGIAGVKIIELPLIRDLRGALTFGEYDKHLPFDPKRYFVIFDVPSKEIRGEHAHKALEQFLICLHGTCAVVVDDGQRRREFIMNRPNAGIYIPPMVWATQYKYSPDAIVLVLASEIYEADDYIRDYREYLSLMGKGD